MKNIGAGIAPFLVAVSASAQSPIRLLEPSPAATVGQTIGITDINVTYHRSAVNNRRIWNGLVPYDTPWLSATALRSTRRSTTTRSRF